VVDFGSYTAAAKALGLQTSKLSRRIAALETELGVRLINRTTRCLSLTEAGKTFHRHCLALLDEAQSAKDAMSQILASPQGSCASLVPPVCCKAASPTCWCASSPSSRECASRSTPPIAASTSSTKASTSLCGFAKPPLEDSDLAMRAFGPDEMILVASPELIAAHGEPRTLEDIARMPTLSMASADERSTWRFLGVDGEPAELTHSPRLCTDDLFTLRRAALQGIGAVLVPRLLVANDLEGGALIRLLPSLKAHVGIVHAVFPSRRGMVPAVRALLDLLSEAVRLPPS